MFIFSCGDLFAQNFCFNCQEQKTPEEILIICNNKEIAYLDYIMCIEFQKLVSNFGDAGKEDTISEQRRWLRKRSDLIATEPDKDNVVGLLKHYYFRRIKDLFEINRYKNNYFKKVRLQPVQDISVKVLLEEKMLPQNGCIQIDRDRFFIIVSDTAKIKQGLYIVDVAENTVDRIIAGLPKIDGEYKRGNTHWLLLHSIYLQHGIMSQSYFALIVDPTKNGKELVKNCPLVCCEQNGETGFCGTSIEHAKERELEETCSVSALDIIDVNNDGMDEIVFLITEMDCCTWLMNYLLKSYAIAQDGFE